MHANLLKAYDKLFCGVRVSLKLYPGFHLKRSARLLLSESENDPTYQTQVRSGSGKHSRPGRANNRYP